MGSDRLGQGGKYRHHKYTWATPFGTPRHQWEIVGKSGAVHFTASFYDNTRQPSCGLEFHHLDGDGAPHHLNCPLTGGRCWHDGTSLYAEETIWPMVAPMLRSGDHDAVFRVLEHEADRHFSRQSSTNDGER